MPIRNASDERTLEAMAELLREQEGTLAYGQARAAGLSPGAIRRAADGGRWHRLHRGVYYLGALPAPTRSRMWAAHLAVGGSGVVAGAAASHAWGLREGELPAHQPVLLLVPDGLHVTTTGIVTRRVPDPGARAHSARVPPVITVEHAVLDEVRLARTESEVVEAVLRACRLRLTTPDRIREAMAGVQRVRHRALVGQLCGDVTAGVTSPLELRYRNRVVRAHGLPGGRGQVREATAGGVVYRDVVLDDFGIIVELDGRLGHESETQAWRDQWRDNAAALTGRSSLRFGWMAVAGAPCEVAGQVAALLALRGWRGAPRRCSRGCPVGSWAAVA